MQMSLIGELNSIALEAYRHAGDVLIRKSSDPGLLARTKTSTTDIVTDADLAAEKAIVDVIDLARPNDGLVREEGASRPSRSGITWVIDPLDSTANFVRRIPIWSVSIAARDATRTLVGVVGSPQLGEIFSTDGKNLRLNDAIVATPLGTVALQDATGLGGWGAAQGRSRLAAELAELTSRAGRIRIPGSPALGLAWTAAGRADFAYYEQNLNEWDMAAGLLMCRTQGLTVRVEEQGGRARRLLASQPALFEELEAIVFDAN